MAKLEDKFEVMGFGSLEQNGKAKELILNKIKEEFSKPVKQKKPLVEIEKSGDASAKALAEAIEMYPEYIKGMNEHYKMGNELRSKQKKLKDLEKYYTVEDRDKMRNFMIEFNSKQ